MGQSRALSDWLFFILLGEGWGIRLEVVYRQARNE
jgi:hypothetical protein